MNCIMTNTNRITLLPQKREDIKILEFINDDDILIILAEYGIGELHLSTYSLEGRHYRLKRRNEKSRHKCI